MWAAVRYRPVQDVVLAALSALITACAVFAPLYDRGLQQAVVQETLRQAPVRLSGLSLTSSYLGKPERVLSPFSLAALVPGSLRRYFGPAVQQVSAGISVAATSGGPARAGTLRWREGFCARLALTAGRCPSRSSEVAVSAADSRAYGWGPGTRVSVVERLYAEKAHQRLPTRTMTVSGVYSAPGGDYWFGQEPTGRSGTVDPDTKAPQADDWLTVEGTLDDPPASLEWVDPHNEADLVLARRAVGVDQLLTLGPAVQRFADSLAPKDTGYDVPAADPVAVAYSGLPGLAEDARHDRAQADVTVPLLMVQLALLAMVVLWLVLGAATDQRRPEVALSRLRGYGPRGARALLLRELGAVVLTGVPLGAVAAGVAFLLVRSLWMPPGVPFEPGLGALAALAASAVAVCAVTLLAVRRTARASVPDLLRRVPTRQGGWGLSAGVAVVVAAALTAFVALVSGGLQGTAALVAPSLLALAVGLLLSQVGGPAAAAAGRWLLSRGRITAGVGALQSARGGSVRRVAAVVVVATALLVFAADALVVGDRNRTVRAAAESGAPVVVSVAGSDIAGAAAAAAEADPAGRSLTPVVQVSSPGTPRETTQAVIPAQFAHVASWPTGSNRLVRWAALDPPSTPPLVVRGSSVSTTVRSTALVATGKPAAGARLEALTLLLRLVDLGGRASVVPLAALPVHGAPPTPVSVAVPCSRGCLLTGLVVQVAPFQPTVETTFTVSDLTVADTRQPIKAAGWQPLQTPGEGEMSPSPPDRSTAGVSVHAVAEEGSSSLTMSHASVPTVLPAVVAGPLPANARGDAYGGLGLDGVQRPMRRVAALPYVPGAPLGTSLVNLQVLLRDGASPQSLTQVQVWAAREDPALLDRLRSRLRAHGVAVTSTAEAATLEQTYATSAAARGLQLGIVVGGAALLIAALVLLVLAAGSWRGRARDLATLRMSGLPPGRLRSMSLAEHLPVVVVGVLLGAVCGVAGAHYALPLVPLFSTPPTVPVLNLSTSWAAVLAATVAALLVLVGIAWATAAAMAGRAHLDQVREGA